ncbi:uncharacterized DUF4145 family protein [Tatumella ptyseos ATCC 33301]|uniref:Uncharacterized DUF4145 family protein n=2 Tax=Tatumella ptyseos TaxID=82987 RepID=A0A085JCX6_9GAMM|nr:DUF4145 domain-containing protein [Tatumella ptyseos]KFD18322.1 uncharacterized DUF4145 family protein [Tatumella ptyseos ATCC 33301]SQK74514.1 Uncharacterised protein [Tatumella ptyseos]
MTFILPDIELDAFTCPECGVYAQQVKYSCDSHVFNGPHYYIKDQWLASSTCKYCNKTAFWIYNKMIYPHKGSAPLAHQDMPNDVKADYEEAAYICSMSPRSAAALLRLAIEKLCNHLGGTGNKINDKIGSLVKKGLPVMVQQSLDVVRVTGNNAVHPGQIDTDSQENVSSLFGLINIIVEVMITNPKLIQSLYDNLPVGSLKGIATRDKKN